MAEVKEAPKPKTEAPQSKGQVTEIERKPTTAPKPAEEYPFAFMRRFADEMDRLFEDFGLRVPPLFGRGRELLRRETGMIPADWSPRIDVKERDGRLIVHADLPGLSKHDIHVEVSDDILTIRGERKREKKEEREGYHYNECSYGSFYRSIPLPEGSDSSKATAAFQNGVLEVGIPLAAKTQVQSRRVEVQEKK